MSEHSTPALLARGINKNYGHLQALRDFSLELPAGQIVGLMGENGSGKTTLLKIFAGAITNYTGTAQIFGTDIGPQTKAHVSFLPDNGLLANSFTVRSAMAAYADFFADFDAEKAREMLDMFGLEQKQRLGHMSKGMREKLHLALCLGREADVYLLDEPLSGVDPAARGRIMEGILRGYREEALMLISTHLISEIENIIDTAVFVKHGQILLAGQADELRAEHASSLDELFRKVY